MRLLPVQLRRDRDGRPTIVGDVQFYDPPPPHVRTLALCAKLVASFLLALGCAWLLVSAVVEERGAVGERETTDAMWSEGP